MPRLLRVLWVLPVSLPAAALALLGRATGGHLAFRDGVLEAAGGALGPFLTLLNPRLRIAAITLGHVVLARTRADLDRTRPHERVHVRQFERWGAFFPFLYLGASAVLLLRGGHVYWDNPYEREARAAEGESSG